MPELVAGTLPLLDVAPYLAGEAGALGRLGAELCWAFENVGFYYLRGHGIPQSLIDATFAQAARFHALPMDEKLAVEVNAERVVEVRVGCQPLRPAPVVGHQAREPAHFVPDDPAQLQAHLDPRIAGAGLRLRRVEGPSALPV